MQDGLISVVMSNFNTPEKYLRESIESIINQTYNNFEFIIIDDCSTDNSVEVIESYNDSRIILIKNDVNLGITKSLNKGISASKGSYIARMDADDVAMPERFEKQVAFLQKNSDVIVCGTAIEYIGDGSGRCSSKYFYRELPSKDEMRINLLFGNFTNIVHPTAMFNAELLRKNNILYNEEYKYAQDYRMWLECCKIGKCYNLDDVLLKYRVHGNAVSTHKKAEQDKCVEGIISEQLLLLGLDLPVNYKEIHYGLLTSRKKYSKDIKVWMDTIIFRNKKHKIYNQKLLKKLLYYKWSEIVYFRIREGKLSEKIKAVFSLNIIFYPNLLKVWLSRSRRR